MLQFFGREAFDESGERVSNIWVICLEDRDSHSKEWVIPGVLGDRMVSCVKVGILRNLPLLDKPISYQLVGEVMAHQGLRVADLRG